MLIRQSKNLFKIHRFIWQVSGIIPPKKFRILYFIWSFVFNIVITLFYPIHLIIGVFQLETKEELFKNLAVNFAVVSCVLKFAFIWYHLRHVRRIEAILDILDKRINSIDEKLYFGKMIKNCKFILLVFAVIFSSAIISSELSTIIDKTKRLMYPAWFPIDWESSTLNYCIANIYQCIGVCLAISSNYASDSFPPVCIAVLSGQVRLLALRMSELGTDTTKSLSDNNRELKQCIKDHGHLIELYHCMQKVISKGMFVQIVVTGMNLCCIIIFLVFFADNFFSIAYFTLYILALALEIFPCCYCGSIFEIEFSNLPYALFSSNWVDQDMEFKKNIIIFSERCLYPTTFLCMGMFRIHLNTFYVTMKSAYSLFTVILQTK